MLLFWGVFWMFYLKLFHILTSQFATTTVTFRIESGCCYRFVLSLRWSTCCRFLESDLKSFKWRSSHVQHQIFSTCVPNFQDDVENQTPRCLHTKMQLWKMVPCRTGIERNSSKIYVKCDVSFIMQGLLFTRSMLAGIWKPDFLFANIWGFV